MAAVLVGVFAVLVPVTRHGRLLLSATKLISYGFVGLNELTNGAFAVALAMTLSTRVQGVGPATFKLTLNICSIYTWPAASTMEILTAR